MIREYLLDIDGMKNKGNQSLSHVSMSVSSEVIALCKSSTCELYMKKRDSLCP